MIRAKNRERILEASLKEFSMKGYDTATLDAIAEQANVSRLTVLNGFGSKIELFRSTINHFCRESLDLEQLDGLLSTMPASQQLESLLIEFYKILFQHIYLLRIFYFEPNLHGAPTLNNWNLHYDMQLYLAQHLINSRTIDSTPTAGITGKMLLSTVAGIVLEHNLLEDVWDCNTAQLQQAIMQIKGATTL